MTDHEREVRRICAQHSQQNALSYIKTLDVDAAAKAALRRCVHERESENKSQQQSTTRCAELQCVSAEKILSYIMVASVMTAEQPMEKPAKMIESLSASRNTDDSKQLFVNMARLQAICGGLTSIKETSTAVRCWSKFATTFNIVKRGQEFPPTVSGLLAWSRIFAVKTTYANYMYKLALACEMAGLSKDCFHHPSIIRAKRTISSLQGPAKEKRGIRLELLERLVGLAHSDNDKLSVLLNLVSYCFLLRVPSEGLPLEIGQQCDLSGPLAGASQSCLVLMDDRIVLRLRKRKNRKEGSVLTRFCWCKQSKSTCPVHAISEIVKHMKLRHKPFQNISGSDCLALLRSRLRRLGVPFPYEYETKDFRRGHARDLVRKPGGTLKEVMEMGQWKSPAMLAYLDVHQIETEAILEAHIAESASENEDSAE